MKTDWKQVAILSATLALTGCGTSGLSRRERPGITYPAYVMSLQPKFAPTSPREIKLPLRLAVAQAGETAPDDALLKKLEDDKALVQSLAALPAPADLVPDYASANGQREKPSEYYSAQLASLCDLARAAGADYLFFYGGNIDRWHTSNALRLFDLTLIGAFVVPSTSVKADGKAAGALINVDTRSPVLFVSAETRRSAGGPSELAYSKQQSLVVKVRDELNSQLAGRFLAQLGSRVNHVEANRTAHPTPQMP